MFWQNKAVYHLAGMQSQRESHNSLQMLTSRNCKLTTRFQIEGSVILKCAKLGTEPFMYEFVRCLTSKCSKF